MGWSSMQKNRLIDTLRQKKVDVERLWNQLPRPLRWPLAAVRQLPLSLTVAKLPIPYNFSVPLSLLFLRTFQFLKKGGARQDLFTFYFKTFSRTAFGFSLKKLLEQAARYSLNADVVASDDFLHLLSWVLIVICIFIDVQE
jgi:hypothetical protein